MEDFKSTLNVTIGKWPLSFGGILDDNNAWKIELTRTVRYGQKQNIYTLFWYDDQIHVITTKNSTSRTDDKDEFTAPIDLYEQVVKSLPHFQTYIIENFKAGEVEFDDWVELPTLEVFKALYPSSQQFLSPFFTLGRVIDKDSGIGLKGVDVKLTTKDLEGKELVYKTKTNGQGEWTLNWKSLIIYPTYGSDDYRLQDENLKIQINKEGYNSQSLSAITSKKQARITIPIVYLDTKEKSKAQDISKIGTLSNSDVKSINKGGVKTPVNLGKLIQTQVKIIANRLIPVIIGLLYKFGITQVNKWVDGQNNLNNTDTTCPPNPEELKALIAKRNRLVRQLNNIYKVVDTATKALGLFASLISIFKTIINIFKYMPLPTTIGLPPGPQGGVITSATYGKITRAIDKFDSIKGKVELIEKLTLPILTTLILLRIYLLKALQLLKILDDKLDECSQGLNIEQTEIDNELAALLIAEEEDGNPVVIDVNGFTMGVEVDSKKVGSLNRRYATASNAQGVVLLKGEPSFSASDQILIDELTFYIQSNNLKAQ